MLIKKLRLICLSLNFIGCMSNYSLPNKPNGLVCTYFESKFYCNEINNPDLSLEYDISSIEIQKAICMPLDTFKKYQNYVNELKNEVLSCKLK
jgi:hypothetical protein